MLGYEIRLGSLLLSHSVGDEVRRTSRLGHQWVSISVKEVFDATTLTNCKGVIINLAVQLFEFVNQLLAVRPLWVGVNEVGKAFFRRNLSVHTNSFANHSFLCCLSTGHTHVCHDVRIVE